MTTRHEKLCEAVRPLGICTTSATGVVDACLEAVPDATDEEIRAALSAVAQEAADEAVALELYGRMGKDGITGDG
jgi:hypothetical protein